MIKSALGKVMWVGRATVFVVGLAVILAMVVGVSSAAFGANGDFFKVGNTNVATAISKLTMQGTNSGSALQVTQQSTNSGATGVGITVPAGKAPIKVNSGAGKATNLDADKLDGQDSTAFALAGRTPMWAVVKADGTLLRSTGDVSGIIHPEAGFYRVNFNRNISSCAYSATIDGGLWGEISVWRYAPEDPSYSGEVAVVTRQSQGSSNYADAADKPFQLVVFC